MFQKFQMACCCSAPLGADLEQVLVQTSTLDAVDVDNLNEGVRLRPSRQVSGPKGANPTMAEVLQALKAGGGVVDAAGADKNEEFFELLDSNFPELAIYKTGKIQTSPGIEEIEGSPTEYYRTVGAMIALVSCYANSIGDEFGIDAVSKGARGPMSIDKIPGKFISMGNKPKEYNQFCSEFAKGMVTEDDWWGMLVFLAVHDVGKSDSFRNAVNATLPVAKRSDDHDRALARALTDFDLKERFLPSVMKLSPKRQDMLAAGFLTNFQLPQLGQGEIAVINLRGLLDLPAERFQDGSLRNYMYHSIFDIAGASSNEKFIYPLALAPVYLGFGTSMNDLMVKLTESTKLEERGVYFDFLYIGFKKAFPEFEEKVFRPLCESKIFRNETGLAVVRVLALTRNTYTNAQNVLDICRRATYSSLIHELSGAPNPPGPQVMLYYAPDMLRMGLGTDLADASGDNMLAALGALDNVYGLARKLLQSVDSADYQFQLNVQPVVSAIKEAGKAWTNGSQLRDVCNGFVIEANDTKTEGILVPVSNETV